MAKPHHHHALTKASAVHLHRAGQIPASQRDQIIKSADRGMKAARAAGPAPAPPSVPSGPPQLPNLPLAPPRRRAGPPMPPDGDEV